MPSPIAVASSGTSRSVTMPRRSPMAPPLTAPCPRAGRGSPKQLSCRIPQQAANRIIARHRDATHQRDRDPIELAHHQLSCGSELVHNPQLGPLQLVAIRVSLAPIITQRQNPGCPDSNINLTFTPGPAEAIGNDEARCNTRPLSQTLPQPARRLVGTFG